MIIFVLPGRGIRLANLNRKSGTLSFGEADRNFKTKRKKPQGGKQTGRSHIAVAAQKRFLAEAAEAKHRRPKVGLLSEEPQISVSLIYHSLVSKTELRFPADGGS